MLNSIPYYTVVKKFIFVIGVFILCQNCGDNPVAPSNAALIEGVVLQSGTLRPLEGVLVNLSTFVENDATDADGKYSLFVPLPDSLTRFVSLLFTKQGFFDESLVVAVQNGRTTAVPEIVMFGTDDFPDESGPASNVVLVDIQSSNIFVKGSGADETADLTFEARDSQGIPVDNNNQVKVCFSIAGGPNGGEFMSPDSVLTDANGRVTTTVNSGTIAGALQIVAEIAGTTIQSAPVPIAIHGGLPDFNHFSLSQEKLNIAGYKFFNIPDAITAFVGDQYSNPVPTGTIVQFQSTGGIMQGSAVTDVLGRATATLISAAPLPQGINFSSLRRLNPANLPSYFQEPGFALVTAHTVNANNQTIYAEAVVLFSGDLAAIQVNPTTFNLGPQQAANFNFVVQDINSNPLVAGTSINVGTDEGEVRGDVGVVLLDTQSRADTQFSFTLTNSNPEELDGPTAVTVTISVSSQNGNGTVLVNGTMLP